MTTSVPMRVPLGGDPSMVEPGNNEGDWIRSLRRQFKLSQVEFAALLGVSNVTVNRWERGHVRPQPTMRAYLRQLENHKSPIEMVESATTEIRGNLPERRDGFIGRASELEAAADLIEANRIVSILGPGGSGKTRLAIEVSHLVGHRFPDGVWFIDLALVSMAGLVADAVARTLGVPTGSPESLVARIVADRIGRSELLIFDNCEHVLESAAELIGQLSKRDECKIIATSRIPIGLSEEAIQQLGPLSREHAAELFTLRSQALVPRTGDGSDETLAIDAICTRLDRIPLAIELAAGRTHVLSVSQIASRCRRNGRSPSY